MAKIKFGDTSQFTKKILTPANLQKVGEAVTKRAGDIANFNAGRKTDLAESISYKVDTQNQLVTITVGASYGSFVEFGTAPHVIRAKPGSALAFQAGSSFTYKNGSKGSFGDHIVVKKVNHPGTDPAPFLRPAVDWAKSNLGNILK